MAQTAPGRPLAAPFEPGRDHVLGGRGPVLVVYGDFECPFTRAGYRVVQLVRGAGEPAFRYVFRHFPLAAKHRHALASAKAAEAAALQGRFWELHDVMFERQRALETADLVRYAEEVGADPERFAADLDLPSVLARVKADRASGAASGVTGTPTLFLEGRRVDVGRRRDELVAAIRAASG